MNASLPPRFRESAFRRYEHIIAAAVEQFPNRCLIDPKVYSLSPVTLSHRLRDAMRSFIDNKWESRIIDWEKFLIVHEEIIVSETHDGFVLTGTRDSVKTVRHIEPLMPQAVSRQAESPTFAVTTAEEWTTLCRLAAKRLLLSPILVLGVEPNITLLEQNYDISLVPQGDGSYLLT